jgi:hypothetical protein
MIVYFLTVSFSNGFALCCCTFFEGDVSSSVARNCGSGIQVHDELT